MEIRRSADCGNSPKNLFAETFAISWLTNHQELESYLTEDVVLELVGRDIIEGRAAALAYVVGQVLPEYIAIEMAVTHGRAGAVTATVRRGGATRGLCLAIEFSSVKADRVKAIKAYLP